MTIQEVPSTPPANPPQQPEIKPGGNTPDKRTSPQQGIEQEGDRTGKEASAATSERLRRQWPDFSDEDVKAIQGNDKELKMRLKKVYGFSEERAEREYRMFMTPYESSFRPVH